jgi:hypothetical protein
MKSRTRQTGEQEMTGPKNRVKRKTEAWRSAGQNKMAKRYRHSGEQD